MNIWFAIWCCRCDSAELWTKVLLQYAATMLPKQSKLNRHFALGSSIRSIFGSRSQKSNYIDHTNIVPYFIPARFFIRFSSICSCSVSGVCSNGIDIVFSALLTYVNERTKLWANATTISGNHFLHFRCLCHGDLFKLLFIKRKSIFFLRPFFCAPSIQKPHIIPKAQHTQPHTHTCAHIKIHFAAFNKLIYAKLFIFFVYIQFVAVTHAVLNAFVAVFTCFYQFFFAFSLSHAHCFWLFCFHLRLERNAKKGNKMKKFSSELSKVEYGGSISFSCMGLVH